MPSIAFCTVAVHSNWLLPGTTVRLVLPAHCTALTASHWMAHRPTGVVFYNAPCEHSLVCPLSADTTQTTAIRAMTRLEALTHSAHFPGALTLGSLPNTCTHTARHTTADLFVQLLINQVLPKNG